MKDFRLTTPKSRTLARPEGDLRHPDKAVSKSPSGDLGVAIGANPKADTFILRFCDVGFIVVFIAPLIVERLLKHSARGWYIHPAWP